MTAELLRVALNANDWSNRRTLAALESAADPPARAVAAFQHVLDGEKIWLARIAGQTPGNFDLWDATTLDRCRSDQDELEPRLSELAVGLDSPEINRVIEYTWIGGTRLRRTVGQAVLYLLLHCAQYRGEALGLLAAEGVAVPDVDYTLYLRELET